jgi:hypothetical protein
MASFRRGTSQSVFCVGLSIYIHIFWAPTLDTIAHTARSAEFIRDQFLYAWVGHNWEEVAPGLSKVMELI